MRRAFVALHFYRVVTLGIVPVLDDESVKQKVYREGNCERSEDSKNGQAFTGIHFTLHELFLLIEDKK